MMMMIIIIKEENNNYLCSFVFLLFLCVSFDVF